MRLENNMIIYEPPKAPNKIPLIDISDFYSSDLEKQKSIAWELHKAARETGFFYVEGHKVPLALMDAQLDLAKKYFSQPDDVKMECYSKNWEIVRGYEPIAAQILDEGSPADLKEGFVIGNDLSPSHPYVSKKVPNCGPNQWPHSPTGFKEQYNEYLHHVTGLAKDLIEILALSLNLPRDYFAEGLDEPMIFSRLLHYPEQLNHGEKNQLGAGAHTDWGMLTVLLQDDIGGLEVQNAAGDWLTAPPIPGTFVVNLGEMIKVLTNGLYHSNMHRVLNNNSGRSRYSCPTFFDPDYFYEVSCVSTCMPKDNNPDYQPTTVGKHIAYMYSKTYDL